MNERSEFVNKCRHKNKFLLSGLKSQRIDLLAHTEVDINHTEHPKAASIIIENSRNAKNKPKTIILPNLTTSLHNDKTSDFTLSEGRRKNARQTEVKKSEIKSQTCNKDIKNVCQTGVKKSEIKLQTCKKTVKLM